MTKTDLVQGLSERLGMLSKAAEILVDSVIEDIVDELKQGDRVNISGFGTFVVSNHEARTGRNPKTGEQIEIAASRTAKFKPGKQMKDSLNESIAAEQNGGAD